MHNNKAYCLAIFVVTLSLLLKFVILAPAEATPLPTVETSFTITLPSLTTTTRTTSPQQSSKL